MRGLDVLDVDKDIDIDIDNAVDFIKTDHKIPCSISRQEQKVRTTSIKMRN